jgi:DNA-binding Lrp family transcriptional regulator
VVGTFDAFILLHLENPSKVKELLKVEGVVEAYAVEGEYDAVVRLRVENIDKLKENAHAIRELSFVRSTATLIVHKKAREAI